MATFIDADTGREFECDDWSYTDERVATTPNDDGTHSVLVAVAPAHMIAMTRDDALRLARDLLTVAVADTDELLARLANNDPSRPS